MPAALAFPTFHTPLPVLVRLTRPPACIHHSAVGYPPVEAPKVAPKNLDGSAAPKESLVSLLVNDCLK